LEIKYRGKKVDVTESQKQEKREKKNTNLKEKETKTHPRDPMNIRPNLDYYCTRRTNGCGERHLGKMWWYQEKCSIDVELIEQKPSPKEIDPMV
jgi:hypothetical protein